MRAAPPERTCGPTEAHDDARLRPQLRSSTKPAKRALDCYRLAVEFARWAAKQVFPRYRSHLRDQLVRAADAVVLNIAEGSGHPPGNQRRHHHRIAKGSAAECCSVLDVVDLPSGAAQQQNLRRVGAMLSQMARR